MSKPDKQDPRPIHNPRIIHTDKSDLIAPMVITFALTASFVGLWLAGY